MLKDLNIRFLTEKKKTLLNTFINIHISLQPVQFIFQKLLSVILGNVVTEVDKLVKTENNSWDARPITVNVWPVNSVGIPS